MKTRVPVVQAMQNLGRAVFTTKEIAALSGISVTAAGLTLKRMERRGIIGKAKRGIWYNPKQPRFSPFALVPFLAGTHQAYVSFLSALHLHGLISQIPELIYVATTGHTRTTSTPIGVYSFHRIHPAFFDGFEWYGGERDFLIATPEKALVDSLYVSSRRGRRFGHFPEIEIVPGFSFRRAWDWTKRIPEPRIRVYVSRRLRQLQDEVKRLTPPRRAR